MSQPTQLSFLQQLSHEDSNAWHHFDKVYKPLLFNWLNAYSLPQAEAEDLTQEIMLFVANHIQDFQHNQRTGAFRNWLRQCTVNIARNYLRKQHPTTTDNHVDIETMLDELEQPNSRLTLVFDQAHQQAVVRHLLQQAAAEFKPQTLELFRLHVLEDLSASTVAERANVSAAAVYMAKSRVMRHLRQHYADWLEDGLLL